ncbi:MAG TPA: hypothetical protein VMJ64_13875, partial [Anaerolineales bacterium]|nr:hypothetical protein [Anaerolineales bacterium]
AIAALIRFPSSWSQQTDAFPLRWITAGLYGSFFSGFVFFLAFFWAAERYLIDFFPYLLLLSIMGFWQMSGIFQRSRLGRLLYASVSIALAAASIVTSTLLALGKIPLR